MWVLFGIEVLSNVIFEYLEGIYDIVVVSIVYENMFKRLVNFDVENEGWSIDMKEWFKDVFYELMDLFDI